MRKLLLFFIAASCVNIAFAQESAPQTTLAGSYAGVAPCADCKIIETELELSYGTDTSGEFTLRDKYIGRQGSNISSRMTGEWVKQVNQKVGNIIVLNNDNTDKAMYYLIKKDGSLLPLDQDLQKIEAPMDCTLKKN